MTIRRVGGSQPRHADAITDSEPARLRSERIDLADDLVAWGDRPTLGSEIALSEVQIGPADTADHNADPHLPRSWLRYRTLDELQRVTGDRPRTVDDPSPHCQRPASGRSVLAAPSPYTRWSAKSLASTLAAYAEIDRYSLASGRTM